MTLKNAFEEIATAAKQDDLLAAVEAGVAVTGPLTDAQLRATAVPVSGALTDTQLRATSLNVNITGGAGSGLTDTQLRASAVPVSISGSLPVTIASAIEITNDVGNAIPISAVALPLPSGAATAAAQATLLAALGSPAQAGATQAVSGPLTDTQLRATAVPVSGTVTATGTFWQTTQPVSGPLTDAQMRASAVPVSFTNTALTDTQLRASAVPVSGTVAVTGAYQSTQPISGTVSVSNFPATQPISGSVSVSSAPTTAVTGPVTDTQLRASAVPVSLASTTLTGTAAVTQSGTWTVQPGNTANTVAWKVDGSAVTQPVSIASMPTTAVTLATAPVLVAGSALIGKVGIDQTTPYTTNAVGIPDLTASGSITANGQTIILGLNGVSAAYIQLTGTSTSTVQFEGSVDGINYFAISGASPSNTFLSSFASGNGSYQFSVAGLSSIQVRCSAFTSGTRVITMRASTGSGAPVGQNQYVGNGPNTGVSTWGGNAVTTNNGVVSNGALRVTLASDSTGQVAAIGKAAAGATISGAPVLLGGAARTANPAAVTDGQVSNILTDKMGRLVTVTSHVRDLVGLQTTTITASTSETTIITAVASTFCDITHLDIVNSGSVVTVVSLKDTTAGTTRATYPLGAGQGISLDFQPPMPQSAVNNNWTLTCSVASSSVYANAVFVKNI